MVIFLMVSIKWFSKCVSSWFLMELLVSSIAACCWTIPDFGQRFSQGTKPPFSVGIFQQVTFDDTGV